MKRGRFDIARHQVLSAFRGDAISIPDAWKTTDGTRELPDFSKLARKLLELGYLEKGPEVAGRQLYAISPAGQSFLAEVAQQFPREVAHGGFEVAFG